MDIYPMYTSNKNSNVTFYGSTNGVNQHAPPENHETFYLSHGHVMRLKISFAYNDIM